jgi:phosphoribosylformylglycinamidine cyclo-ligase
MDIVNHCVNDILCNGAKPLFFLDYIAMGKLIPKKVREIVSGMTGACRDVGCALIGGETAEMPGIYLKGTCDLAGFIVGVVEKKQLITGHDIVEGDLILGLRSNGLHTNGYSLARKVFGIKDDPAPLFSYYSQLGMNIGESLLRVHRCYYNELAPLLPFIKGLAHITGGGFEGNISRIMPDGIAARLNTSSWEVPEIFNLIQQKGNISNKEMYRVFNMGIGMVVICSPRNADKIRNTLPEAIRLGEVINKTDVKTILYDRR